MNALDKQIGGDHYKHSIVLQPIEFIVKANLTFIQGCIVKYITRYKFKNGKQDIEKARHYAQLAIELGESEPDAPSVGLAYNYCTTNKFKAIQKNIIVAAVQGDYFKVIWFCNRMLKQEFS